MILHGATPFYALPEEPEIIASVSVSSQDDAHVYVHCHCSHSLEGLLIRIWKTTFLIDAASGARSQLIHAENITMAPLWTIVPPHRPYSFLLIFSGLPGHCRKFDFIEEIPQPGGFTVRNIPRNETDVYHIDIM